MAPKVGPPAAVLKFMREHSAKYPEQGAAIMLAVQSGVYDGSVTKSSNYLIDVKRLDEVPDEFKTECMTTWLTGMTADMWLKIQKATYDNGQKQRPDHDAVLPLHGLDFGS